MVITIQKYRFIADLLTAWEAEGFAMGIDQQLKIRHLLQKIPEDYALSDLKTLLAPIFAHDAKQQEVFYDLFDRLFDVGFGMSDVGRDAINRVSTPPPTSDIPNPILEKFRLKNKRLWLSIGISLVFLTLIIVFFDEILKRFKPSPTPERYVKVNLNYDVYKPDIRTFRFDSAIVKPVKSIKNTESQVKGVKISITEKRDKPPFFTAEAEPMSEETDQVIDTVTFLFTYKNEAKERIHYVFTINNKSAGNRYNQTQIGIALKPYQHAVDTATLHAKESVHFKPLNGAWSWGKTAYLTLFGSMIWGIGYWRRRKEQRDLATRRDNKTKPPYSWRIKIEGIENAIQLNDTFFRSANDMRRRSEMDIRRLDMPRTIQATIKRAGMPNFMYRQPTQANEYLVLIDQSAAQSHRAKLFDYLMRRWQHNEVLIDRFFFNGDMRLCWNEKNPRGLTISDLRQRYPAHRLIIVGHGFWLLKTMVVEWDEWTAGLLDNWKQKVLLTPRMPEEWDAREAVLAKKLRILPAILRGVGDLAETLDALEIPNYKRWQQLELEEAELIRLPKKLSADTLMIFLESHFITYTHDRKRDDRLLQWIAACAVSPIIHWDITLAFGQLIAANNPETDSLVTLDSMFQLTRLAWFNEATMPDEVRRPLLDWFEKTHPSVLAAVRVKWAEILAVNKPPTDSLAFDDYSLALTINALHQKQTARQKQRLNKELERCLVNEPRQDFLVLDYLAAQRTPLDGFVPKRFQEYLRDPERRIPTLQAWVWQVPMLLLGMFVLFSFNYSGDCIENVVNKDAVYCIKNKQDELTLFEYAISDVLNQDIAPQDIAFREYAMSKAIEPVASMSRDAVWLLHAQKLMREHNLDTVSFYQNLKIAYVNAAIQHNNKTNKDSTCLYLKLSANLQTKDSVLTAEELREFDKICNPIAQQANVLLPNPIPNNPINDAKSAIQKRVSVAQQKVPNTNSRQTQRNAPNTNSPQTQSNAPNTNTAQATKDTTQKNPTAKPYSMIISGLQKDVVIAGESVNVNYVLTNETDIQYDNLDIHLWLGFETNNGKEEWLTEKEPIVLKSLAPKQTIRGVAKANIPKGTTLGKRKLTITAEWNNRAYPETMTDKSSRMIEIRAPEAAKKY